ncbi:uncharacterized protein LOC127663487, partial [Xyrauchen texanus]|uniref:uncharacterized protein LOC127663487 n=1 Tax=Xyrauchen texanus TaxID=154827 RepID=UPI00224293D0
MSRSSSPTAHWDHLEAWLSAMMDTVLPKDARDLQPLGREQLDAELDSLMAHNPTQSYNHKEWTKIIGSLAHNLVAQARINEKSKLDLEQEATALKLQAVEARRNQAKTQSRLDQLRLETEEQRKEEDETDPEQKKEVERLQNSLENLRRDTDQREQSERKAREELDEKLQQGESLLARAETALKDRDAKARACEKHLNMARAEIHLDKLARNIPTFTPNPAGGHDVHAYLQDIDFHLHTVPNVTMRDRVYLLRIMSSRDVRSFLDRQQETVKSDYLQLRQAFIREFSDPESEQGLIAAMDLKQARLETPQAYYSRIQRAYSGARNEPGMEEDFNFKTLFLRNLHPTVSHHLGVLACPRSMTTQQLRDLAHKAFTKQKIASE